MHTTLELNLTGNDLTLRDKKTHPGGVEVSMHRVHQHRDQWVLVGVNNVSST